jgi:two-component system, OmpR family, response regulator RegX3
MAGAGADRPAAAAVDVDPGDEGRAPVLSVGEVELEVDAHRLRVRGEVVHITHKEFLVLRHLLAHAGRVCSRRELLDAAWGVGYEEPPTHKSIEVFIRRVRRRLEIGGSSGARIRTVRGLGYVFDVVAEGR